ncbi:hypothetical protein SDC9_212616 [bioreactor metagenome]|uniref:Uncharacterized protein n=1 Tax=bioreactor metagenome TaxID=1076179 RepID=A0A645JMG0_9ZZZZ
MLEDDYHVQQDYDNRVYQADPMQRAPHKITLFAKIKKHIIKH